MDTGTLVFLLATLTVAAAWSIPYYPVQRAPLRVTRYAPHPAQFRHPAKHDPNEEQGQRPKRDHHDYGYDHDHDHDHHGHDHGRHRDQERKETRGVTGPVHTFVKTDKNANYKWGVRHHVGNQFAN
ncbi:hypothetical protein evm_008249 [Chilo suppressalis]|nr:hypothetical protein evm_008249 [Chilo suppressalis]